MTAVAQGELRISALAGADLSAAQFKFGKWSSGTIIVCAAATDIPAGVIQEGVASGRMVELVVLGPTKLEADAAITAGAQIGTSADGQADPKVAGTDTTNYVCGVAMEAAAAAGDIFHALVNCITPHRAA